jgi:hypothetical protein
MLLQDIPVKVVAERLGHASIEISLNTYGHLLPSIQKKPYDCLAKTSSKTRKWERKFALA